MAAGRSPQARHDGRKMPRLGGERNARQVFRGGEDVALPGYEGSAESRIEKILLRNVPGDKLAYIGTFEARLVLQIAEASPGDDLFRRSGPNRQARHGLLALLVFFLLLRRRLFRVEAGHKALFDFVGVAQDVAFVEVEYIGE